MCISKTEKKDNEDVYNTTIYSSVSKYSYNANKSINNTMNKFAIACGVFPTLFHVRKPRTIANSILFRLIKKRIADTRFLL